MAFLFSLSSFNSMIDYIGFWKKRRPRNIPKKGRMRRRVHSAAPALGERDWAETNGRNADISGFLYVFCSRGTLFLGHVKDNCHA